MATIMNGTEFAVKIKQQLKEDLEKNYLPLGYRRPRLAVILVGNDMASQIYVAGKVKACEVVGIKVDCFRMEEKTTQAHLNKTIKELNKDKEIDGILLQLPLPHHLNSSEALNNISAEKDVDGLTNKSLGKLMVGDRSGFVSCTPSGVVAILKEYGESLEGKKVTIIGRSILVGKPLALLLLQNNATVTICHSKTKNLKEMTKKADIVISAAGQQKLITSDMIGPDAVIVDVGINRNSKGKVCGDVDFKNVSKKASLITPVPGGIGPLTIAMLLSNVMKAYKKTFDR